MRSKTIFEDRNQVYSGTNIPTAEVIIEDAQNLICQNEVHLESICFSSNRFNSVNSTTLRRRFKPKIKLIYWINKTKEVTQKNKTDKFDF